MIIFRKLRWRNLLSTGNVFTEVTLDSHGTTLIVGENGAGKSTILDALSFGLYGKPFRKVNKNQLINSINNKGLLVEVEFSVLGKNYLVRRGAKPNIFEIYQDDKLIDLDASVGDYQEVLDKQVLKLNHKSFSQIVVLGSASFVPFMQLSAANRREVIEDLLDIEIFTTMNLLLKEKIQLNKSDIQEAGYQIQLIEDKIDIEKAHISELKTNKSDQVTAKEQNIQQLSLVVQQHQQEADRLSQELEEIGDLTIEHNKLTRKQTKVLDLQRQLATKLTTQKKEIEFFDNHDDCPVCKQGIAHDFKVTIKADKEHSVNELDKALGALDDECRKLNDLFEKLAARSAVVQEKTRSLTDANHEIAINNRLIASIQADIDALKANNDHIDANTARLKELNELLKTQRMTAQELSFHKATLDVASVMLKDSGIKTKIIRQYVPIINKLINKYLASMDFFVNFELNENFEETIKSRFRDVFSYASFSEGEKGRIDLALLFTWRAIARLRNSASTNLLILDEVFDGSLDSQGNEELIKIIGALTEGSNVFVISHKTDVYLDKFERVLKFEKVKSFSRMVEL